VQHEAANGVEFLVREARAEHAVEFVDPGESRDRERALGILADAFALVHVVLVADLTDDFLEHVLDREQPRDAAVLVHHEGHVVVADAELLKQDVEALAFGDEHRGPQALADVELPFPALREVAQQVLGEQDSGDLVAVLAYDREARVPGLDDDRQDALGRLVALDHDHLRARHHDVANLRLRDLQDALQHREHVGLDQPAVAGVGQQVRELLDVPRFTGE